MYKTHRLELLGYVYLSDYLLKRGLHMLPARSHASHHDTTVNGLRIQNKITSTAVTKNPVWTASCHKKIGVHKETSKDTFVPYDKGDWDWLVVVAVKPLTSEDPYHIKPLHIWWISNETACKQGLIKTDVHKGLESLKVGVSNQSRTRKPTGRRLIDGVDDPQFTKCVDEQGFQAFHRDAQGREMDEGVDIEKPVLLTRLLREDSL
jgi:hypothetical protein